MSFYMDMQGLRFHRVVTAEIPPPVEDAVHHMYELYLAPSCTKRLNLGDNISVELHAYLGDIMATANCEGRDHVVIRGEQPMAFSHISKILTAKFASEFINAPYFFALKKGRYEKFEITADAASSLEQHASREEEWRHCVYISISKKALVKSGYLD
ncbi:hypothetical protein CERSUDRAFT_99511 [Gelatoporia subvermispora B]|uniref:Uncharacterized protein n=1 Tax=Ceriporiopsis subvermispora (strain B) TaxID=914234 RepID=M2R2I0_CERS8|nr:hypothetical protein CERSUDRAFT_99511 [Gelatoporia subvermispora B]